MKLTFLAAGDQLVTLPNQVVRRRDAVANTPGAPLRYVGREHVPAVVKKNKVVEPASNPATKEGLTLDSETDTARRIVKKLRQDPGCLLPGDEETAKFLRGQGIAVKYQATTFSDGEHVIAETSKSKSRRSSESATTSG